MEDVMFVFKCLVVTLVLVVCFQIRVGNHTVEGHLMSWIHRSPISQTFQDVAEGAVKAGHKGKEAVVDLVSSHSPMDAVADAPEAATEAATGTWFKIKRSAAYYRQKGREELKRSERRFQERDSESGERAPDRNDGDETDRD